MGSLLTDEELEEDIRKEYGDFRLAEQDSRTTDILYWVRETQDVKSVRAGRNDVVGWLGQYSDIMAHIMMHHEDEWGAALKEWGNGQD